MGLGPAVVLVMLFVFAFVLFSSLLFYRVIRKSYLILFFVLAYLIIGLALLYVFSPHGSPEEGLLLILKEKLKALIKGRTIIVFVLHSLSGISIVAGLLIVKRANTKMRSGPSAKN